MIRSMTGYGKADGIYNNKKISVEIRSLNSKQMDLNVRLPGAYKEKELELRSIFSKSVERGKADVFINSETEGGLPVANINKALAKAYHAELKSLAQELHEKEDSLLALVLRMPEVLSTEKAQMEEQEWELIKSLSTAALEKFHEFRASEGLSLYDEFKKRIHLIDGILSEIELLDNARIKNIKDRIRKHLDDLEGRAIDENRYEQEIIYYLEKIDISEEKLRLRTHLNYFITTIEEEESQGRKLGFITQEIGREINTIGSKANDASIQKLVVLMKDELEKIKEQLLNVL